MSNQKHQTVALLAEDNPADVFVIREAIRFHQLSLELHLAGDGDEACEFIERAENDPDHNPGPDVVLLDLNLPKRNGREVLKRLRESRRYSTVPVVIITSSDLLKDRQELSALGASRFFHKPSGYTEFLKLGAVVKELLGEQILKGL